MPDLSITEVLHTDIFADFCDMTFLWLILLFVFIIVEALTVNIVSIWFAIGSLCSMAAAALKAEIWLQIIIFIVVSAVLIFATRPLVKKFILPKHTPTNYESIIGATAVVSEDINNIEATGTVKINGTEWTARSDDGQNIGIGTEVTVIKIEGVKAIVSKTSEAQSI